MKQMKVVGVLILLLGAPGCGESQSSEIDRLKREVADLDRENQQLWEQADLHKKEPWKSLANWNRIAYGMTRTQVSDILGHAPAKAIGGNDKEEEWLYGPRNRQFGRGSEPWSSSVTFKVLVIDTQTRIGTGYSAGISYEVPIYGVDLVVSDIHLPRALLSDQ